MCFPSVQSANQSSDDAAGDGVITFRAWGNNAQSLISLMLDSQSENFRSLAN
jgi:hypothetical protein